MRFKTIMIVVLFFLSGCTHHLIGESVNYGRSFHMTGKGHHSFRYKHILVEYDYSIDKEANTIDFDGIVNCNKDKVEDWYHANIELELLFVNAEHLITDVKYYSPIYTEIFCTPKPFKASYPFKGEYEGISFGYTVRVEE